MTSRFTASGHAMAATCAAAPASEPFGQAPIVRHAARAPSPGQPGVGSRDKPRLAIAHELGRAAAVGARHHGLARGKRFGRNEAVVLANGREADGAAPAEVKGQRFLVKTAGELHPAADASGSMPSPEIRKALPFAGDHGADVLRQPARRARGSEDRAAWCASGGTPRRCSRRTPRIDTHARRRRRPEHVGADTQIVEQPALDGS